jgi:hypothetical protein
MEGNMEYDIYFEANRVAERFKKPVIVDGEYFESYAKAAKKYNTYTSSITYALKHGKTLRGKKVEKVDKTLVKQIPNN